MTTILLNINLRQFVVSTIKKMLTKRCNTRLMSGDQMNCNTNITVNTISVPD